jgi:uncharacterized protein YeaO (DUF488 family)
MLKVKSVYSTIDKKEDGFRILATRSTGMFLRKTRYDIWMPNLAPSTELLKSFQNEEIVWNEFMKIYRKEILSLSTLEFDKKNRSKNNGQFYTLRLIRRLSRRMNVTLLCMCDEDQKQCHRHLLRELVLECEN